MRRRWATFANADSSQLLSDGTISGLSPMSVVEVVLQGKTEQTFMAMLKKVAIVVVAWVVCVLVYLEFFTKSR